MINVLGDEALAQVSEVVRRVLGERRGTGVYDTNKQTRRANVKDRLIGKTDASITKGSSGTVSVYRGTTKGSETDSGIDITAYNRFADLGADKWCFCEFIGGGWELYVAECG